MLLERVRGLPGVTSAAAVSSAPFAGPNTGLVYLPAERPVDATQDAPDADYRAITPGYLQTLGIGLVRGRDFTTRDDSASPPVMIVNQTFARTFTAGASVQTLPLWIFTNLARPNQAPVVTVVAAVLIVVSIFPVWLAQRVSSDTAGGRL